MQKSQYVKKVVVFHYVKLGLEQEEKCII